MSTPRRFDDEVEKVIATKYAAGDSITSLSKDYGCSNATIRGAVKRNGGTIRPRGQQWRKWTPEEIEEICRRYQEDGQAQSAIAAVFGTHQVTIGRILRSRGITPEWRVAAGERHRSWKGGKILTTSGYAQVLVPWDSPYASMRTSIGYVMEHRLVMAQALGRPLRDDETVHHINGDQTDNRPENLQLRNGKHGKGIVLQCNDCGSHNVAPVPLK